MTRKKFNMPDFDIIFVGKIPAVSVCSNLSNRDKLTFQTILTKELDLCKRYQEIK